jgi:hypothetical protein
MAMTNRLWIAAFFAATPILALTPMAFPASQDAGCARSAAGARYNQRVFSSLMRRNDVIAARKLEAYKVTRVKPRDVKSVSDHAICERAAIAYARVLNAESSGRKVHILRVGDRYVVTDLGYQPGSYRRAVTFDSTFTRPFALVTE